MSHPFSPVALPETKLSNTLETLDRRPILITIVGGGPTGLLLAALLKLLMKDQVEITVRESRWIGEGPSLSFGKGRRRKQVVTIQSRVWSTFHPCILAALFVPGGFSENWPLGPDSPTELGFPRNIRICDFEDRLLDLCKHLKINLVAEKVDPDNAGLTVCDLLVCCDGPGSRVRDHFASKFGAGDPVPYSLNGTHLVDTILSLRVRPRMRDVDMVALTVSQYRDLYNGLDVPGAREGSLYSRLTQSEASEAYGSRNGQRVECTQSTPAGLGKNDVVFAPSVDPNSKLWPRIKESLKLYGMTSDDVLDITTFKLSMVARPRAVAEITPMGAERPCFAALCGDAASAIHFWPGRGLTGGAAMAIGLAHTVAETWNGRTLRSADLMMYEAIFAAIRHRHADRAWRAFMRSGPSGPRPIHDIIGEAQTRQHMNREKLLGEMDCRIVALAKRLSPRMPAKIDTARILRNLRQVSDETLQVMVESGAWETSASGGPELDLARLVS